MMSSLQTEKEIQFLKEDIQNLQPLFEDLEAFLNKTNLKPFLWKNEVFFQDDLKREASQKQFWDFNCQPDQHHYQSHPGYQSGFQGAQFPNHYRGVVPGGAGGIMAPPDFGGRLCPPNSTGTSRFSDLPTALHHGYQSGYHVGLNHYQQQHHDQM